MIWIQRVFGILLLILAVWVVSPIFISNKSGDTSNTHQLSSGLVFERVSTSAQLTAALKSASASSQPVLLDFYADWCVTCKEMELLTFSDQEVTKVLKTYRLIQIDMTKNTADHQATLKQYGLFGPPAILFFDEQGLEKSSKRVIGFMKADRFLERLK
jgi:thiol:disulfide interchange protein DsbD